MSLTHTQSDILIYKKDVLAFCLWTHKNLECRFFKNVLKEVCTRFDVAQDFEFHLSNIH